LVERKERLKMTTHDTTADKPLAPVYWRTPEQAVIDALEHEVAALRKDAERYRWLRSKGSDTWLKFEKQWHMGAEECDIAIDNEMAKHRMFGAA
jgi:hypothetical protein